MNDAKVEDCRGFSESEIDAANREAIDRICEAVPILVDVRPAGEVIPDLGQYEMLHAGPPLAGWQETCGALRGSIIGTLMHQDRASDVETACEMASSGAVRLTSANERAALATYAGVITRTTPVLVVEDEVSGRRTYAAINEGRGKALRYGCHDPETLAKLGWLEGDFAELLGSALRLSGGIKVFSLLRQALHMGDDGHSRHKAASALLLNALAPALVETGSKDIIRALHFLAQNEIFFLPITMAAAKNAMLAGDGVPGSTIATCFATNGVRFGIKLSGLAKTWSTAPVPVIEGRYFEGYSAADASPVIGDSEIAECFGLGAFAMAAAPALAQYVGGSPDAVVELATGMYRITLQEHPHFTIPSLSYRGTPFGIDARQVVAQRLEPIFNTGIAHREPGVGQIGAGLGRVPLDCFRIGLQELTRIEGDPAKQHSRNQEGGVP
jgi:hypothetical protein